MERRKLGGRLEVSALGLGCMGMSFGYGRQRRLNDHGASSAGRSLRTQWQDRLSSLESVSLRSQREHPLLIALIA